ncbi:MAG: carbohydrate ABC transporter permease [Defluviitaleaceae bacterium]|nr:carbohydrate ABC transporter permease [Defluviitaleaceae bacterium]
MKKPIDVKKAALDAAVLLAGFVFAAPVAATFAMSFVYGGKIGMTQYYELMITNYTFLRYFWNSLFYACVITVCTVALSLPLGFIFSKVSIPGRDIIFFVFIIVMMLPFHSTLLPIYIQLDSFGLLNTRAALVLSFVFAPYAVFLFRQFAKSIPDNFIDIALMDTSSPLKIYVAVIIPHMRSAVAALAVITFCESWNMVEQVIFFAAKNNPIHPLSAEIANLPEGVGFSAAAVYMLPALLLFFIFKEAIASSMERFRWHG